MSDALPSWASFEQVIAHDTSPHVGEHRVASDARLRSFIDEIARPALVQLGVTATTDGAGNLIASFGPRTGHELMLIVYPATHHGNLMPEPLRARVEDIDGAAHWVGQGASEGKAGFVCLLEALARASVAAPLAGRVLVAISTEGSSTNHSSTTMFDELGTPPAAVALMIGTEGRVALGHRGRADVLVSTTGIARHSSTAAGLPNPIADICRAQQRILSFADMWSAGSGASRRSITAYRLVCGPVAPHTMPERCELALDCRFLHGDDLDRVLRALRGAIDDESVDVRFGPVMLPAAIEPSSPLVSAFVTAGARAGVEIATFDPSWTFDAGAADSRGIPAILYGPSSDNTAAIDDTDAVPVSVVRDVTATLTEVLRSWAT